LWFGAPLLPIFLFYMALAGAVLRGVALYIQRRKPFATPAQGGWIDQIQNGQSKIPYGVAITFGMVVAFIYAGYVSSNVMSSFITSP
jgi:Flp pilus assembly protein protease CpaA